MGSRLEYLEEIQLIRERKRMEELEYLPLKRALAQEVAYNSILVQKRKELHKNVADSIERIFDERLHEFYGMLAFHYSQADDLDNAESTQSGRRIMKSSASSEALRYYRNALELPQKTWRQGRSRKSGHAGEEYCLALFNRGQYSESVEYFDKALAFLNPTIPKNPIIKALKFGASFIHFLVAFYLPFLKWKTLNGQGNYKFIFQKNPSPRGY